jgi:hypothetical protein
MATKRKPSLAVLFTAHPSVVEHPARAGVARDIWQWGGLNILHQEPGRLRLDDAPFKLWNQIAELRRGAAGLTQVSQPREHLARWATDYSLEDAGGGVEGPNIAAPQNVRAADDAEAFLLKCSVQQTYAREQTEDQRRHAKI